MYNLTVTSALQFNVILDNVPGSLAKIAKALAGAGVNIESVSHTAEGTGGKATLRLVADDQAAAKQALTSAGNSFTEEDILLITCPQNKPGTLAAIAQAFGDAGINLEDVYYSSSATQANTVVCVQVSKEDLAKAGEIAKSL
ncbi:MAG: hypothetical protein G01um10148_511 [Parcubacteria group bacterium Gr01-1014_8]|nr:MAG: hypothetical protein G01um10148_511 [Parcubacteria group bacterium Gr01-1014_8]